MLLVCLFACLLPSTLSLSVSASIHPVAQSPSQSPSHTVTDFDRYSHTYAFVILLRVTSSPPQECVEQLPAKLSKAQAKCELYEKQVETIKAELTVAQAEVAQAKESAKVQSLWLLVLVASFGCKFWWWLRLWLRGEVTTCIVFVFLVSLRAPVRSPDCLHAPHCWPQHFSPSFFPSTIPSSLPLNFHIASSPFPPLTRLINTWRPLSDTRGGSRRCGHR